MTELESIRALERYDQLKRVRRRRKTWIKVISILAGLFLAWIAASGFCKTFKTKKLMSYWWSDKSNLKLENQHKLPSDWTTWYKDLKENPWYRKFGKSEDYFTNEEIAKRELAEEGKKLGGKVGEELGKYLGSNHSGVPEEEKKKVNHVQHANYVYGHTACFLIVTWLIFWLIFYLIFRYLVLPLSWKEPLITEQNPDKI
jgi:hypothetical protein